MMPRWRSVVPDLAVKAPDERKP